MESKLIILLSITIVAQSSLARNTSDSCVPETEIGTALETIDFAQNTVILAYARYVQVIYKEIMTVLAGRSGKFPTHPEHARLRAERAQNNSLVAVTVGIVPTMEAIKLFQRELDVQAAADGVSPTLQKFNGYIYDAIKAAQGKDYSESRAQIGELEKLGKTLVLDTIRAFFNVMLNGTAPIPDEAKPVVACVVARTEAEMVSVVSAVFEGINILARALLNLKTKDAIKKYSSQIAATGQRMNDSLDAEVIDKLSILRNLVIDRYFKKTGTVTGLFAIQSTSGKRFVNVE